MRMLIFKAKISRIDRVQNTLAFIMQSNNIRINLNRYSIFSAIWMFTLTVNGIDIAIFEQHLLIGSQAKLVALIFKRVLAGRGVGKQNIT